MKTLDEIADFLEQHLIDCEENTGCGRCDDVRECVKNLRTLSIQKNELAVCADLGSFPSADEIETASLNYRDKSDDENTEDDIIAVNWYDKQEAFTAGVNWFIENYY